jgi:hypothetical protein
MRIVVAVVFAAVGVMLVVPAATSLLEARYVTHQIFAMMQIIAGLLCFLISAVAGLLKPPVRAPAAMRASSQPPAAAPTVLPERKRPLIGYLIVLLAMGLIAVAARLRKPDDGRDAMTATPAPARASAPAAARPGEPASSSSAKSATKTPAGKAQPRPTGKPSKE